MRPAASYPDSGLTPTRTLLAGAVAAYLEHIQAVKTHASARTDAWYLRNVFRLDGPGFGLSFGHVEEINAVAVNDMLHRLRVRRDYSPKTLNRCREVLSRFCNWCVGHKGVCFPRGRNPIADVERYREAAPVIRFLSREDVHKQLEALAGCPLLRAMVAVLILAGLRRSEVLWLTREDVDFTGSGGLLRIRAKRVCGEFWQPKTGTNRGVPVSGALRACLADYEDVSPPAWPWYFPTVSGGRWDPDNFARKLRNANRAAGLPWSCLDYRHTFGSHLAMKGESLYKISALMGNSPDICRRHYAVLHTEQMRDTVEFL
jgi:integrase